jgi:hypothetical protein
MLDVPPPVLLSVAHHPKAPVGGTGSVEIEMGGGNRLSDGPPAPRPG